MQYNLFGADVRHMSRFSKDSLMFDGDATDLDASLRTVVRMNADGNLCAIVLITDGISTTGANPVYAAEEAGIPHGFRHAYQTVAAVAAHSDCGVRGA